MLVKNKITKTLFTLAAALVLISALQLSIVKADNNTSAPQDIEISPASTNLSAPPGGSTQGSMTVINGGSTSFAYDLYSSPYYVKGLNYDPTFSLLPGKTDASKWVQFNGPTSSIVAPNNPVISTYTLNVPKNTAPGGYYAVIFAETKGTTSSGVSSRSRVGNILYITVQGQVTESGSAVIVSPKRLVVGSSLPISVDVGNSGGIHFITNVNIKLVNSITGKVIFNGSYERYVLPQTIRRISTIVNQTPIIGLYKIEASATLPNSSFFIPNQTVFIIHPIALITIPIVIVILIIYFKLPKKRKKTKK